VLFLFFFAEALQAITQKTAWLFILVVNFYRLFFVVSVW